MALAVVVSAFSFQSCDPWEDESYHGPNGDGGGPQTVMYVKEIKKIMPSPNGGMVEGVEEYTYDGQNRLSKVVGHLDIVEVNSYTEAVYQYPSADVTKVITKSYLNSELQATNTITTTTLSSTTGHVLVESDAMDDINMDLTFALPCGITKNVMTMIYGGQPITSTTTYEYTDGNCSYTEKVDGEWTETVFRDNKFSPHADPLAIAMGIVLHNNTKVEESDGTIETISYQYNENDYPTNASHTFNVGEGQANYTETFTYY